MLQSRNQATQEWFSSTEAQALWVAESRACTALGANVFGYHALQLSVASCSPNLVSGVQTISSFGLCVDRRGVLSGVLEGSVFEMPIATHSLKLVAIHHVHERLENCEFLFGELERMLAPDGIAFLVSMNPLGRLRWPNLGQRRARWSGRRWFFPGRLARSLRAFHLERLLVRPVYSEAVWWERALARHAVRSTRWRLRLLGRLASGYVLVVRKRSQPTPILRMRELRVERINGGVQGTATRNCVKRSLAMSESPE